MKKLFTATVIMAAMAATPVFANGLSSDLDVTAQLSASDSQVATDFRNCLNADMEIASSKAIRACSKAYKASPPISEIRSQIVTRRGLLQLSAGRFDKASRDFKMAAKLNKENEFAYLGKGYAALMKQDYAEAVRFFNDCKTHNEAAPMAVYGLALAKEMSGDRSGAIANYRKAAEMRPDWEAPRQEIARVRSAL